MHFRKSQRSAKASETAGEKLIYLFTIDEKVYYLLNHKTTDKMEVVDDVNTSVSVERLQVAGYVWKAGETFPQCKAKISGVCSDLPDGSYSAGMIQRRLCGYCGTRMKADGKERMLKCPKCGLMEFPKICPAVIIGVTHGDRILMSKYTGRSYKNYALLAGFNEIRRTGSSETVSRRSCMEEVGLEGCKQIRYHTSLLMAFLRYTADGILAVIWHGEEETESRQRRTGKNGRMV